MRSKTNAMNLPQAASMVARMPAPERLFLWAIRAWSASHSDLTAVWWSLDRAFAQERVHAALPPFHELMSALFAGIKRWPDIRCVACPNLGVDEGRLLRVLAQLQQGNEIGARRLLEDWLVRTAVRVVCRHAAECVAIVSAADLRFTLAEVNPHAVGACADRPHVAETADLESALH